jgi:hypothetical protein
MEPLDIKEFIHTKDGLQFSALGRDFLILFKFFPEFREAPLSYLFDVTVSLWNEIAEDGSYTWHEEDAFHWRELDMDVHARNFFDQSLNDEDRAARRPRPFTTKIIYAPWVVRD